MKIPVFTSDYVDVMYYSEQRMVILIWQGSPNTEQYRTPFIILADFGARHPVDSMVSDISKQGVISPDNRKWFEKEIMPRSVTNGLKRVAVVTNGNAFKLYYLNLLFGAVKKFRIEVKVFKNQPEALKWTDEFSKSPSAG